MTSLRTDLDHYLQLRHRLGHELADAARLLPHYVDYLEQSGHTTSTVADAVAWSQQPQAAPESSVRARRMTAVRGFARYLSGIDPGTEVPPLGLVAHRQHWRPPFIYTADEIVMLLDAAAAMPSPLRSATYTTLFGLLAATGMRVGEALNLDRADIDWERGLLLIRQSKFGKSRIVPSRPAPSTRCIDTQCYAASFGHGRGTTASSYRSPAAELSTFRCSTSSTTCATEPVSALPRRRRPASTIMPTCALCRPRRGGPCGAWNPA